MTAIFTEAHDLSTEEEGYGAPTATVPAVTTTDLVRVMMHAYEQSTPSAPTWPSEADYRLRVRLDLEEFFEKLVLGYYQANAKEILDGACDIDVVNTGSILTFGMAYDPALREVNRSNMSKLDPATGKPIKDGFGKVTKHADYSKADLVPFLGDLLVTSPDYNTKRIVAEETVAVLNKYLAGMGISGALDYGDALVYRPSEAD